MNPERAVVVTGMGLVTPLGRDQEQVWSKLIAGASGAALLPEGALRDTGASYHCPVRDMEQEHAWSRSVSFARAAVESAIKDSGIELEACADRTGVCVGSSKGAIAALEEICRMRHGGGYAAGEGEAFAHFYLKSAAQEIAGLFRLRGPVSAPMAACATGAYALLIGNRMIERGEADIVIAGGTDSCITPLLLAGYKRMGVLAGNGGSPQEACKPYDVRRNGFVLGEGCGIVILEEREHARARGAKILALFRGGAVGQDIHHALSPDPSGEAMAELIKIALVASHVGPERIDYINTHGTGTRLNDPAETRAIKAVFGAAASRLSLSSTKPMTGHLLGAAGSVEFIISLMALRHGVVPPTINLRCPDPECDLDYTPLAAKTRAIENVMSLSSGFGGHIGVLIAGRYS
ncbi:MAG: beta-ketoacyl-[acyl-carrier-protein] synthase family protein [Candidatus Aureabacteria bacterium]|nr:beta-ketoacyl-[acyl-carrier-protein] synthase family protein [Candidatus Auribacterota bacterium]